MVSGWEWGTKRTARVFDYERYDYYWRTRCCPGLSRPPCTPRDNAIPGRRGECRVGVKWSFTDSDERTDDAGLLTCWVFSSESFCYYYCCCIFFSFISHLLLPFRIRRYGTGSRRRPCTLLKPARNAICSIANITSFPVVHVAFENGYG